MFTFAISSPDEFLVSYICVTRWEAPRPIGGDAMQVLAHSQKLSNSHAISKYKLMKIKKIKNKTAVTLFSNYIECI